jgi:homoserine kinase
MTTFTVTVPATTANIGPGFDCLGAALTLYNQFTFTALPESTANRVSISVKGTESAKVSQSADNLIYTSFLQVYQKIGQNPPPLAIEIGLGVPLSRGLGSSATAIIGGLIGANYCAGNPLSVEEIQALAIALEGHPDNVVPALRGNCQLSAGNDTNWTICQVFWQKNLIPVVAIPDFELATEKARAVLPQEISRQDAIFNISRLGLLLRGLETGNGDWLRIALEDKLHQPYRQSLIPGYEKVQKAAINAGAYGMVISGAGPTLLALTNPENAEKTATAMKNAWQEVDINSTVAILALDTLGARLNPV